MSADPSVDLAVLDALFAAATRGEWETDSEKTDEGYKTYVMFAPDGSRLFDALNSSATLVQYDYGDDGGSEWDETARRNFALIAALHNAWPAIKRRLEIGDAAVEALDGIQAECNRCLIIQGVPAAETPTTYGYGKILDIAARARLRALREAQNG